MSYARSNTHDRWDLNMSALAERLKMFQTTQWTALLTVRNTIVAHAEPSIGRIYSAYWVPLTLFLQRLGFSKEDAEDYTQGFFLKLADKGRIQRLDRSKGRLRDFLCTGLRRFAIDESAKRRRRPIDYVPNLPDVRVTNAKAAEFDREWARHLIELSCQRMLTKLNEGRDSKTSVPLFRLLLQGLDNCRLREVGKRLGLSEAATKMRLFRIRQSWQNVLREEIHRTVPDAMDVDSELRHLIKALESTNELPEEAQRVTDRLLPTA